MWRVTKCVNCQDEAWTNSSEIEDVLCDKCYELTSLRDKVELYEIALQEITNTSKEYQEDWKRVVSELVEIAENALGEESN